MIIRHFYQIGTCGYCIRTTLRLALAACLCVGAAWATCNHLALLLAAAASLLFTCLWLLHIVVFAFRRARRQTGFRPAARLSPRREFMRSFFRAGVGIAALTAIGAVSPLSAFAQDDDPEDRKRRHACDNAKFDCGNACMDAFTQCENRCSTMTGFDALQCIGMCNVDHDSCKSECEYEHGQCINS